MKFPCPVRLCHCKAHDDDPLVKNDLSISPARMYELAQRGQPISEQAAVYDKDFIDGYSKLDFDPPYIYTRHADMIGAWNRQIDSRQRMLDVSDSRFGIVEPNQSA